MLVGSRSLPRLRCVAVLLCLTVIACGEAAAPAAVPEEFDDPFADDPVVAAKAVPGDRSAADGATGSGKTEAVARVGAEAAGASAGSVGAASAGAVEASAGGVEGASAGGVEGASAGGVEGASAGGAAVANAEGAGAGAAGGASVGATGEAKKGAKKPAAAKPDAPAPVPSDSPPVAPEPAPAPAPAPAPEPEPAPVQPAPPVVPAEQRFVGTFKFVGGDAQRQNLETAIEAAAMELNALIRGIGRKRLRDANPIREQVTIAVDGDKVSMTSVVGRTLVHRIDGPAVPWTSDSGKAVQVSVSLVKGRLVQTYTADDGGRRNTWTLDESGDRLTLSVTVTSDRLTNPLKYALSYRRN
ncbi:hypothetical protein [Nannocystis sp.]|uniref:hypothetical protein n=1 Tax=Nannocystis sp. TaxID=1962667 RepID=UPI0025F52166|nr:hypothetical protein [Nannocystis sp.]MBK7827601.1 hypothetical protein [Nannocystis sp.]